MKNIIARAISTCCICVFLIGCGGGSSSSSNSSDSSLSVSNVVVTDSDFDGFDDDVDNCPNTYNPQQLDSGSLNSSSPDGIGDLCQCGDVNDNGIVDNTDAILIKRSLLGLPPGITVEKCNVNTGAACDNTDAIIIQRTILGLPPGLQQSCDSAINVPPPPIIFAGGAVKGPLANASFSLSEIVLENGQIAAGEQVAAGVTGASGLFEISLRPITYSSLLLEIDGALSTDITTGNAPTITQLKTIVTPEMLESGQLIFASVLSTLATDIAAFQSASIAELEENLLLASAQTLSIFGFGADTRLNVFTESQILLASLYGFEEARNVTRLRLANEATATAIALASADPNQLLAKLSRDLKDGRLDGLIDSPDITEAGLIAGANFYPLDGPIFNNVVPQVCIPNTIPLSVGDESCVLTDAYDGVVVSILTSSGQILVGQWTEANTGVDSEIASFVAIAVDQVSESTALGGTTTGQTLGDIRDILIAEKSETGQLPSLVVETIVANALGFAPILRPTLAVLSLSDDLDGDGALNAVDAFPGDPNSQLDANENGIPDQLELDTDADSFIDFIDNCPADANATQLDLDEDGFGDACDDAPADPLISSDADADMVSDAFDNCPLTPNTDQTNTDGDSFGDACDLDRDGDGVDNNIDNCPLTPNADQAITGLSFTIGDACDQDDDDVSNDNDGSPSAPDNCPLILNPAQSDFDGDFIGDFCDQDIDGDGIENGIDQFDNDPTRALDGDGDGIDELIEPIDNCPSISNPDQTNTDNDAAGSVCDDNDNNDAVIVDPDNDGIDSSLAAGTADLNGPDNCPAVANPGQEDLDSDGSGNVCDADADGDGVPGDGMGGPGLDINDLDPSISDVCDPSPFNAACTQDSDGDGESDFIETEFADADSDGIPDYLESSIIDSDGDGASDEVESSITDTDSDGLVDQNDIDNNDACVPSPFNANCAQDTDGDGDTDFTETETADFDGDGTPDYLESSITDTDSDGVVDEADPANNFACIPSPFNANCAQDSDGDGDTDFTETETADADADGTPDYLESSIIDADGDGTVDEDDPANTDGCIPDAMSPTCGTDNDGDGIDDALDADDDNDSRLDASDPDPFNSESLYHFDFFYSQLSSGGGDFKAATIGETVVQSDGSIAIGVNAATSTTLDLGNNMTGPSGDGIGNFNVREDYQTVEESLLFSGAGFAAATGTAVSADSLLVSTDASTSVDMNNPTLDFTAEVPSFSLASWGINNFIGAGRVALQGVGSVLATAAEQAISVLSFADGASDDADLSGTYGFIEINVTYSDVEADAISTLGTRVVDLDFDGSGGLAAGSGGRSEFISSFGLTDGSITFENSALSATSYTVSPSGAVALAVDGATNDAFADAAGDLVTVVVDSSGRAYGGKLGTGVTAADLIGKTFDLSGLVVNSASNAIEASNYVGATISFADAGGGNLTATLAGSVDQASADFDAMDAALPTVASASTSVATAASNTFTVDGSGRIGTITFASSGLEIEGYYTETGGLLLRLVHAVASTVGGGGDAGLNAGGSFYPLSGPVFNNVVPQVCDDVPPPGAVGQCILRDAVEGDQLAIVTSFGQILLGTWTEGSGGGGSVSTPFTSLATANPGAAQNAAAIDALSGGPFDNYSVTQGILFGVYSFGSSGQPDNFGLNAGGNFYPLSGPVFNNVVPQVCGDLPPPIGEGQCVLRDAGVGDQIAILTSSGQILVGTWVNNIE